MSCFSVKAFLTCCQLIAQAHDIAKVWSIHILKGNVSSQYIFTDQDYFYGMTVWGSSRDEPTLFSANLRRFSPP